MVWSEMREIDSAIKLGLRVFDKINRFRILKPAIQIKKKHDPWLPVSEPNPQHILLMSVLFFHWLGIGYKNTMSDTERSHIKHKYVPNTRLTWVRARFWSVPLHSSLVPWSTPPKGHKLYHGYNTQPSSIMPILSQRNYNVASVGTC